MASTYKVLGQAAPGATTATDLYTVPGATSATASTLVVTNRSGSSATFRISVAVAGAVVANKQYLIYDLAIPGNDVYMATIGITLAATDVVRCYASSANISFNLYGVEIT